MSAEKIVYVGYPVFDLGIQLSDDPGDTRCLSEDELIGVVRKLNEHARLVEALRDVTDRLAVLKHAVRKSYPMAEDELAAIDGAIAESEALLAEVEKEKTP